ncbi:MAG: KTSC domain-containing protein [Terracidiphilus sp.]
MAELTAVKSSWVQSADYSSGLLTVITKKGAQITFIGVPSSLWEQFQAAPSKGEFINKHLKGKFKQL